MFRIIMIAPHKIFIFLILEHFKIVSSRKLCLYNYLFFHFPREQLILRIIFTLFNQQRQYNLNIISHDATVQVIILRFFTFLMFRYRPDLVYYDSLDPQAKLENIQGQTLKCRA